MTMLGSDLKDEDILPESPAAEPHDLIPSYLPVIDTQASTAPDACHPSTSSAVLDVRHLAFLVQHVTLTPAHLMHGKVQDFGRVEPTLADACTQIQVEDEAVDKRVPEETADLHG